jgi:hypothetical protein
MVATVITPLTVSLQFAQATFVFLIAQLFKHMALIMILAIVQLVKNANLTIVSTTIANLHVPLPKLQECIKMDVSVPME